MSMSMEPSVDVKPISKMLAGLISKTLPVGLCRNFATDGEGHAVCLQSRFKEPSLARCLRGQNCDCYDPEWHGFEERYRDDR